MVNVSEALDIDRILEYYGFNDLSQRTIITADGFDSYDDLLTIGDSDIINISNDFSDRTDDAGKTRFVLLRTNLLKTLIHWAHDFRKISQTHSLAGIGNASKFSTAIEATRQRNRIRKLSL